MNDPKRWLRLKTVHERVFELPLEEARAFVERELGDDPALARELISILEQRTEGTRFLRFDDAPQRSTELPFHHRLGDYELMHVIGRGGMGCVYLARHLPLDRDVALKVLGPNLAQAPEQVDRFRREALRLARFKHPGIVPIYDVQSIDGVHFFAMELVDGLDLHRELVCLRGKLDPKVCRTTLPSEQGPEYFRRVADITRQAAEALADAHQQRITHRDIKPHNLILGRDGRLRIVDFGIARDESLGRSRVTDEAAGTPHYMSPEQARLTRNGVVDHRTDIYSLGVVLYELLTLRRPFEGDTQRDVLRAIELREARPARLVNPEIPRDLAVICQRAMEKEPTARYPDARELAADLARFLAGEPIHATAPTSGARMIRVLRRRRTALAACGVAIAALAAGYGLRGEVFADPNFRTVAISFEPGLGEPAPQRASWIPFDPVEERFDPPTELGQPPYAQRRLKLGPGLVRLEYPAGAVSEHWRVVSAGRGTLALRLPRPRTAVAERGSRPPEGMVLIPGGTLRRKSDISGSGCSNLGKELAVDPFYLDVREVTVGDVREYLRETGSSAPENWEIVGADPKLDDHPVVGMPYSFMVEFAEYYGKRLPTHAELEWAARGEEDRNTPNGRAVTPDTRAAIHGRAPGAELSSAARFELWKTETRPVGQSPDDVTPAGVFDLLGNVRESTISAFVNTAASDAGPKVLPGLLWQVGGAWYSDVPASGFDIHGFYGVDEGGGAERGFRCAKSARP